MDNIFEDETDCKRILRDKKSIKVSIMMRDSKWFCKIKGSKKYNVIINKIKNSLKNIK